MRFIIEYMIEYNATMMYIWNSDDDPKLIDEI